MTITEAAKAAKVHEKTIRYNIKAGNLTVQKIASPLSGVGYYLEIDKDSFDKWLKKRAKNANNL